MEQCSTLDLIKSTRAFEERVRYWKNKGLTHEEAEVRARKKNDSHSTLNTPRYLSRRIVRHPPKIRPFNSHTNSTQLNIPEPTEEQVQEVLSKLFETGQATLLNEQGQVIRPEKFSNRVEPDNTSERRKGNSVLRVAFPAIQVLATSSLLFFATIKALGGFTLENVAITFVLESGFLSLGLTKSKSEWATAGMRLGAAAIFLLGFFLLHSGANLDHNRQVTQSVSSNDKVSSIKRTKEKLEADLQALPATHRTARNELLGKIEAKQTELDEAQALAMSTGEVGALERFWVTLLVTRLTLQLLNVFFGHNLISQMRKEGLLT
jgi:hypothetical protein